MKIQNKNLKAKKLSDFAGALPNLDIDTSELRKRLNESKRFKK